RAATVSGTTVRTETSGAGGAALANGVRRRAATVPTRTRASATTAVHVAGLIRRFMRTPAVEGDGYPTDSAVMNYMAGKVPAACFSEAALPRLGGTPPLDRGRSGRGCGDHLSMFNGLS